MKQVYNERRTCRSCGTEKLKDVFSIGNLYVINFPDGDSDQEGNRAPMDLLLCQNPECGLVQLRHTVNSDILFRQFWYKSGINQTMRNALTDITTTAKKQVALKAGDRPSDTFNDGAPTQRSVPL